MKYASRCLGISVGSTLFPKLRDPSSGSFPVFCMYDMYIPVRTYINVNVDGEISCSGPIPGMVYIYISICVTCCTWYTHSLTLVFHIIITVFPQVSSLILLFVIYLRMVLPVHEQLLRIIPSFFFLFALKSASTSLFVFYTYYTCHIHMYTYAYVHLCNAVAFVCPWEQCM